MTQEEEPGANFDTDEAVAERGLSMLTLGVVGASIHEAPVELLSALTLPPESREERLAELLESAGFSELVYLSTCNRVEFYFRSQDDRPIHTSRNRILDFFFRHRQKVAFAPENFYGHSGIEAARHLFTVASALDSLVLGEAQILGQVKEAWSEATRRGHAGAGLAPAFHAAFHCARRVRRDTDVGVRKLSMASLAGEVIREFTREVPGAQIALVGASALTTKLAEAASEAGAGELWFVNRTVAHVESLARNGRVMSLEEFKQSPPRVDAVLTATSAPVALFGREEAETLLRAGDPNRPFLFIDLALPRDVTDDVARIANVRLWHLGTLRDLAGDNRRERFRAADKARQIVDEEVTRYHDKVVEAMLSPLFGRTHIEALAFAQSGLESLFAGRLEHLSAADKESVRYWVLKKLVPGVVHLPLKALAKSAGAAEPSGARSEAEAEVEATGLEVQGIRFAPPAC